MLAHDLAEIRSKFSAFNDEELRRLVYIDYKEYEIDVLKIAKEELFGRYEKNIWEAPDVVFKDIIIKVNRENLEKLLNESFNEPFDLISKYVEVLNTLKTIEPVIDQEIYILLEVESFDMYDSIAKWKVAGEDRNNSERISLEYCSWNEWLGFRVRNEDLQRLGVDRYAACCLIEMTSNGFNEETIKESFIDTISNIDENTSGIVIKPDDLLSADREVTFEKIAERGREVINNVLTEEECSQIRPWIRYFARSIDMSIWVAITTPVVLLPLMHIASKVNYYILSYLVTFVLYILWVPIEALFISKLGYTPGKWILNTRVYDKNGERLTFLKAFSRACNVLIFGKGFEIPIISIITNINSYFRLTERGKTKWDEQGGFIVSHKRLGTARTIVLIAIVLIIPLVRYLLNL